MDKTDQVDHMIALALEQVETKSVQTGQAGSDGDTVTIGRDDLAAILAGMVSPLLTELGAANESVQTAEKNWRNTEAMLGNLRIQYDNLHFGAYDKLSPKWAVVYSFKFDADPNETTISGLHGVYTDTESAFKAVERLNKNGVRYHAVNVHYRNSSDEIYKPFILSGKELKDIIADHEYAYFLALQDVIKALKEYAPSEISEEAVLNTSITLAKAIEACEGLLTEPLITRERTARSAGIMEAAYWHNLQVQNAKIKLDMANSEDEHIEGVAELVFHSDSEKALWALAESDIHHVPSASRLRELRSQMAEIRQKTLNEVVWHLSNMANIYGDADDCALVLDETVRLVRGLALSDVEDLPKLKLIMPQEETLLANMIDAYESADWRLKNELEYVNPEDRMKQAFKVVLPYLTNIGRKKWKHLKRGSKYMEMARAELQIATKPPVEGDHLVIYADDTGKVWARYDVEFEDGRFEQIKASDHT